MVWKPRESAAFPVMSLPIFTLLRRLSPPPPLPLNELQGSGSVIVAPSLPRCPCLQRLNSVQEEAGVVLACLSQVLTLICQHFCYNVRELTMVSAVMERCSKDADLGTVFTHVRLPVSCRHEFPIQLTGTKGYSEPGFPEIPGVPTERRW